MELFLYQFLGLIISYKQKFYFLKIGIVTIFIEK